MHLDPGAVICGRCASYVHPFLDACPVCGEARHARYEAALAQPDQGLAAVPSDPGVAKEVGEVVLRYSLKFNATSSTSELQQGLGIVGGALAYRLKVGGEPAAGTDRGHLEVGEDDLIVSEHHPSRERARVPLATIVAASAAERGRRADAWAGLAFEGRPEPTTPPPLEGDLVITAVAAAGLRRISLANRTGILADRARPDHYVLLARWIGMVAAAAAERRWTAIGARRHAYDLGLVSAPVGGWPAPAVEDPQAAGPPSVADALRLLEELRAGGLLSEPEYAAKRREVLSRI